MLNSKVKMSAMLIWMVSLLVMLMMTSETSADQPLKVGFYQRSCPSAERIVRTVVSEAVAINPRLAAGLIRLSFHDCFVRGCDASLLLKTTPENASEQEASPNRGTLRGLEVIDRAKAMLEAACPVTVSCADILSFAARDSVTSVGGFTYSVPAGRRDGVISQIDDVNLPGPSFDINSLRRAFKERGLSLQEMVALVGAHSIGMSECRFFSNRLYFFNATHPQDPSMDPAYAKFLKRKCPEDSTAGSADLDPTTPIRLDNQFYKNLNKRQGLFTSDQVLQSSPLTSRIVTKYMNNPTLWAADFAAAMVRLNSIGVLTGKQGEIRRKCGVKN